MIHCRKASMNINLEYSVIKFLSFQDFNHTSSLLYLPIQELGDLIQVSVRLKDDDGNALKDAYWQEGTLFADFQKDKSYQLDLRLEYGPPYQLDPLYCDFSGIPPLSFRAGLDFAIGKPKRPNMAIHVRLGKEHYPVSLEENTEQTTQNGYQISFKRHSGHGALDISGSADNAYDHVFFPTISFRDQ